MPAFLSPPCLPADCGAALRPLHAADAAAWSAYLSLPGVIEHTSWGDVRQEAIAGLIAQYGGPEGPWRWAIVDGDDRLMGTVGFNEVVPAHGRAELAYDLDPACRGRGLATQAAAALIAWAWKEAGLTRVQATVLDSNLPSIAVLQRLAMRREGLLRAYRKVRGQPRDFWLYATLP
ncbi:GNAT family N-acetyltransferase [Bordetella hinzii]|uniref:Acetyltransferase (GNAT) domain protein n=1 Tax=Bordetella hinzii OH87 BAL007II TaxID=1331262 RepID=A0ABR4R0K9_9BORD|nr:GNAT family protein [Bordetella hinzii]AKQ56894.1 Ribosomal-protein-serine acetyltransferase [Bordetella hinzii]KCB23808.1 acetyltransferase (GNAT) domain protein [Bordetella hinzii OH87 BAL007II]KCB26314.1 acetyltransferase (GNAT) domain protein [Bordetella hinzii L60]KCB32228.1 acetyltransferase (GNAT) domain protein [Bordetella hinzii CA90 BAL1384]KCB43267.1 acetyltransferase (GNAT) domain protein [Bordetella hinzii 5132]